MGNESIDDIVQDAPAEEQPVQSAKMPAGYDARLPPTAEEQQYYDSSMKIYRRIAAGGAALTTLGLITPVAAIPGAVIAFIGLAGIADTGLDGPALHYDRCMYDDPDSLI